MDGELLILDDFDPRGKTVLIRLDINSPVGPDGAILDNKRFRMSRKSIGELEDSKVVLMTHQSRPGKSDFTTMGGHAKLLRRAIGRPVTYVDDIFGSTANHAIKSAGIGDILLLENVRFFSEEMLLRTPEQHAGSIMVRRLSPLADFYINDAFAACHRSHCSLVGFCPCLPSAAGRLLQAEIAALDRLLSDEERPCTFVFGGIKVDDTIDVMDNVLKGGIADNVLVGGMVAQAFLWANGIDIGEVNRKIIERDGYLEEVKRAKKLLSSYPKQIRLPRDLALGVGGERREIDINDKPMKRKIADIGIGTIMDFREIISDSAKVVLNGPMGIIEKEDFALGSLEVVEAATRAGYSVVGGGHTAQVVDRLGIERKISHVSTGGGACIDYLAGKPMPGIDALREAAKRFG